MTERFTLAINAGGKSSRMGTDKAFVDVLGKPLIEHIIDRLQDCDQSETILLSNNRDAYLYLGLPLFSDDYPDKGSLGGIYTAINHSKEPYTFVVACDMPFVTADMVRYMVSLLDEDDYDVVVPRVEGYPQGLFALYSKRCLEPIKAKLDADRLKVIGFYDAVRVRHVDEGEYGKYDPDGTLFHNVNTPEELEQARRIAKQ